MSYHLDSDNPLALATGLSDLLIEVIRGNQDFGGDKIADKMVRLRDSAWLAPPKTPNVREASYGDIMQDLTPAEKTQLLEAYARLGHLYDIAALAARDNYFSAHGVPQGAEHYAAQYTDVSEAIEKLNQPVFEPVLTMHPTNTNSRESMYLQRQISEAVARKDERKTRDAVEKFLQTSLLKKENGETRNFTVHDETRMVLDSLGNIYNDLPAVYKQFDDAFRDEKFGDSYDPQKQLQLHLRMHPVSWGSAGDKDGNHNVTAEDTLEAIAMHTDDIVSRYQAAIKDIEFSRLEQWKDKFHGVEKEMGPLLEKLSELRIKARRIRLGEKEAESSLSQDFDKLSEQLATLREGLNAEDFVTDLTAAYDNAVTNADRGRLLDIIRRVRTFGFSFADIEYREKAGEYSRVVGAIIPDYEALSPQQRVEKLTQLLKDNPAQLQEWFAEARDKILKEGADKLYRPDNPLPIAYHTLKRLELAADFPDMIKNNVLSECGQLPEGVAAAEAQPQAVAHMLEAVLLQRFAAHGRKKAPLLGVVPLFEEAGTMERIDGIMRDAYHNEAYLAHLNAVSHARHGDELTQQVQIAHSDNTRRIGLAAARGLIHEAHKKLRRMNEVEGVRTQFFEGGSISDAYRNGVRAVSASVDDFRLHDFMKFTFQGGDLLNYFNTTGSNMRQFSRQFINAAEKFKKKDGNWVVDNARSPEVEAIDDQAIAALKRTRTDYEARDFTEDGLGILLALQGYQATIRAGTKGSRAESRSQMQQELPSVKIQRVPVKDIRTIGMSATAQHGGILPSWLGCAHLAEYLDEVMGRRLEPEEIKRIYAASPAFRDATDRIAYGLAMTDRRALNALSRTLESLPETESDIKEKGRGYLAHLTGTFKAAGRLACEALTGERMLDTRVPIVMRKALPRLTEELERKIDFRNFLLFQKSKTELDPYQLELVHNAGNTVMHGRCLPADDIAYGKARRGHLGERAAAGMAV